MSGQAQADRHHERRWRILGVVALAQLMVVLDVTIVNIALPSAQADLGFDTDSRQWVITAYALAFGSLLLLGGKISDLIGRKWTLIAGLGGFAGASALGGAAPSLPCWRPRHSRSSPRPSPIRSNAARRSASMARSLPRVPPWGCCSAASSPSS